MTIPTELNHVPNRISSVLSSSDLMGSGIRRQSSLGEKASSIGMKHRGSQDIPSHEREGEDEDFLQSASGSRFRRQAVDAVTTPSPSNAPSNFDRVLEALSGQSDQLADQYKKLKKMTENLANGLKDLQERANISRDSLKESAATLGSELRTELNNIVDRINSTVSGLSLSDLQNGLRSIMTRSTPEYSAEATTAAPGEQMSVESVVSELLTPGSTSTTESPMETIKNQFSQFISGAENFLRRQQTGESNSGDSLLTRFFVSRKRGNPSDASSSTVAPNASSL